MAKLSFFYPYPSWDEISTEEELLALKEERENARFNALGFPREY